MNEREIRQRNVEAYNQVEQIAKRWPNKAGSKSGMRQKGGTSANASRTASVYKVELPDGRIVETRSYQVHNDSAFAGCYRSQTRGVWVVSHITETEEYIRKFCTGQTPVGATRVR